jgi:hypothetical protein
MGEIWHELILKTKPARKYPTLRKYVALGRANFLRKKAERDAMNYPVPISSSALPALVAAAGERASYRFFEFSRRRSGIRTRAGPMPVADLKVRNPDRRFLVAKRLGSSFQGTYSNPGADYGIEHILERFQIHAARVQL